MALRQEFLDSLAKGIAAEMKNELKRNGNYLTGNLQNNLVGTADSSSIFITMPLYGKFIDEGTKGTKNGNPGRKMPIFKGPNGWEVFPSLKLWAKSKNRNEWAVAKKIQKWGTKAYPFIHKFPEILLKFKDEIQQELRYTINANVGENLKQAFK